MKSQTPTARKDFRIPAGIFVFASILLMVLGYFGWRAVNFPVPEFWSTGIAKEEGIWKREGALKKLESWRGRSIMRKWISSTKKLQLRGTTWKTPESIFGIPQPATTFYEFGEDGIFRVRPIHPSNLREAFSLSGSRFEFLPNKGVLALSGDSSYHRPNLFFTTEQIRLDMDASATMEANFRYHLNLEVLMLTK